MPLLVSTGIIGGTQLTPGIEKRPWGASVTGQRTNKRRGFEKGMRLFHDMYFRPSSIYDEADFERRFRMPRQLFERIKTDLLGRGLFVHRRDATGKRGIHPEMRLIAALRVLAYGVSFNAMDELCRMSGASALESFRGFIDEAIAVYKDEYLRHPNEQMFAESWQSTPAVAFRVALGRGTANIGSGKTALLPGQGSLKAKKKSPPL